MASATNIILTCTIFINMFSRSHAEVFSATSDCELLLDTQKVVMDHLDDYTRREEKRLQTLKKKIYFFKKEHEKAMEDVSIYLGNPINSYTLIKRLTVDLEELNQQIKMATDYLCVRNIMKNHEDVKFPTRDDLVGAAEALTRLQSTYMLEVNDLAEGMLNGVSYSTPMSASDCYVLGQALYESKDFKNALSWMLVAHRKFSAEINETHVFSEADIFDYIILSYYSIEDLRNAVEWTKKLFAINPKHALSSSNVPHYKKILAEEEALLGKEQEGETKAVEEVKKVEKESDYSKHVKIYKALCRGEIEIPQEITKRLTCFYLTENHPFLRLARIKTEKRYIDPDVYIFHDVMSDDEIEHVKSMAKPRFKRAVVYDSTTEKDVPATYRISKSAWLNDEESDVIARISRRVSDFTGLSMDSAENLQVANYGIGGHYDPHYDFARKIDKSFLKTFGSNRIATVLFYMSEVAQGGATVFTELGLSVFPVKNAALFWMNLHPSGEGDMSTLHAACPVLQGSKWVSNKWIHEIGQEFIRLCTLEYQAEEMVKKILHPVQYTRI